MDEGCTHWYQRQSSGPECPWLLLTLDRCPPPPSLSFRSPLGTAGQCREPWSVLVWMRTQTNIYEYMENAEDNALLNETKEQNELG